MEWSASVVKILISDDNKEITELVANLLIAEDYEVVKAYSGSEALNKFTTDMSLVILDVMMPDMDGYEVCRNIRTKSQVPVLYLSAKGTDIDKVVGLSSGGDDYMVKPFSSIELIARVKALIRRYTYIQPTPNTVSNEIVIDTLVIDKNACSVTKCGEILNLTKTEFRILLFLAEHRGRVFSTEDIFRSVWEEKYYEGNNTVMVHMARLREKIEDNPREAKIIKNVWGVGYKIEA